MHYHTCRSHHPLHTLVMENALKDKHSSNEVGENLKENMPTVISKVESPVSDLCYDSVSSYEDGTPIKAIRRRRLPNNFQWRRSVLHPDDCRIISGRLNALIRLVKKDESKCAICQRLLYIFDTMHVD